MNSKIKELQNRIIGAKKNKSDEYDHIARETIRAKEMEVELED